MNKRRLKGRVKEISRPKFFFLTFYLERLPRKLAGNRESSGVMKGNSKYFDFESISECTKLNH